MKEIYFDNAASTRTRREVVSAMKKVLEEEYGNPSSSHKKGENAFEIVTKAREKVAEEIRAKREEIIFTSGGTEANNLAVFGLAKANEKKRTIVISEIEHPSIIEPCRVLEKEGYKIVKIGVDEEGILRLDELERILRDKKDVLLVSVMHVNNIMGTIQDIGEIGKVCKKYGVLFHTDAVQSFGKLEINVKNMNVDLLTGSGHKINGPKGVGFLYVREGVKINPIIYGGGQERGLRSGTENVPVITGLSKALELRKKVNKKKVESIRNKFILELERMGGKINGSRERRIYNNINVSFLGINAENLVSFLSSKKIYVSSGSACESKKEKEEETLKAIGLSKEERDGAVRITISEETSEKDVRYAVKEIENAIKILTISNP